jgi:RNA polymerase sigma factor (sigma-70 family)
MDVEPTGRDDAQLVAAARTDEPEAFGRLAQRWFDRCFDLAWHVLHDRELAADVAQDALLTAWQRLDRLERPEAFGGWLLRITRNRALDVLRREVRSVPTDDATRLEPREDETVAIAEPVAAFARHQEHDLVWAAAAALGPRDATLLDLHLRHGLEPHELATELGVAPNAAHQALFRLRKRLATAIRAWLLWRDGEPDCVVLQAELVAAGVERFGPELVRLVDRHVADCEDCEEHQQRVTAPASLFSVVPIVAAPLALRQARFERLVEAGVPVGSSPAPPAAPTSTPSSASVVSRSPAALAAAVLVGVALLVTGVVLVGSALRGGEGSTLAADAAGEDAPQAAPTTFPPLPELVGILPPGATVGDGAAEPAEDGLGEGAPPDDGSVAELTDPTGPAPAPPEEDPPTVAPGGDGPSTDGPPTGGPDAEDPATEEPTPPDPAAGEPEDEDPEEPAPAPTVERFDVVVVGACADGTLQHEVRWATTDAESATLQAGRATPTDVPTSGTTLVCAPRGSTFTLAASGPGGTVTSTATAG